MSKHNSKLHLHSSCFGLDPTRFAAKLTLGKTQRRFCIDMQNFDGLDCLVRQFARAMWF